MPSSVELSLVGFRYNSVLASFCLLWFLLPMLPMFVGDKLSTIPKYFLLGGTLLYCGGYCRCFIRYKWLV